MTSSRTTLLFSLALCALACSKTEPATSTQSSSTVSSSTVSATAPPPASSTEPAIATTASAATQVGATPNAIATADGEKPGIRVDVTELKRQSGGTVMMKFAVVNNSPNDLGYGAHWLGDDKVRTDYYSVGAVHLIDQVGKKKYFVIRDAEEKCVCSGEISNTKAGQKANLWAKFPAPPPDVQKVSVVVPHFTPMDDVPIQ
jgi:hypothetical protein